MLNGSEECQERVSGFARVSHLVGLTFLLSVPFCATTLMEVLFFLEPVEYMWKSENLQTTTCIIETNASCSVLLATALCGGTQYNRLKYMCARLYLELK